MTRLDSLHMSTTGQIARPGSGMPRRLRLKLTATLGALIGMTALAATPALAAEAASVHPVAHWVLESRAAPTNLPLKGEGQIHVAVANLGDAEVNGVAQTITIVNTLPAGLEATLIEGTLFSLRPNCSIAAPRQVVCTYSHDVKPYEQFYMNIYVKVNVAAAANLDNQVTVSGGETLGASLSRAVAVNGEPTIFGVERNELTLENEDGTPDTQAGSHPFQMTSTLDLNQTLGLGGSGGTEVLTESPELARNLVVRLPAGLVGNPTVIPQCTDEDFAGHNGEEANDSCPNDTVVGVATITFEEESHLKLVAVAVPIFNLVPSAGEPAAFGFDVKGDLTVLETSIRTGEDYGVTVTVRNNTEAVDVLGARVTFWGVPGAPSHDHSRGWVCLSGGPGCVLQDLAYPPAFLTLPTSCTGPLSTSVAADAWNEAQSSNPLAFLAGEPMDSQDGCNQEPFSPAIKVAPDTQSASGPSGLTVSVHVPLEVSLNANTPAAADVKDTTVTLPEGVTLNPAGANNLEACSEAQIGFEGFKELNPSGEPGVKTAQFTAGEPSCPDASKIATATIHSPLLPNPLEGEVYLAAQNANPFGSLVAMYLVAKDPVSGVLVKLPGEVSLNQTTGQITSTFLNTPQLPFEELELHFYGGERAPLATPAHCGTYTTNALFTPWSGEEAVNSSSSFEITSGPDGGPCPGASLPFAPVFVGGTTNIQAGQFSTIDTVMGREDGNQNLQAVQLHFPPGFTGLLSGVKLCEEAQANAGTCGPESEIGETVVSVGLGGDPYTVTGGKVYITGPYDGAPFGLSIVNPAVAGPYNLGKVIVRAKVEVNPTTAALTVTTDDSGPYKIPSIIDGIPLEIKHVSVTIDRPGFTINPTSCEPMAIKGTLDSTEGATLPLDIPFQVTDCAALKFTPKFSVSTSGKTSKANGASLTTKVEEPADRSSGIGQLGTQANLSYVKVELPKHLPSRLTTLQKACTAKQFETNPAACPSESKIGYAVVHTPLVPVPLTGPAIFVSHGDEAFPSLTMVLQGYGVTIDLVGATDIKNGVTSTTFKTVPDQPFSTFELTLPEGPYSALAANGNLCHETKTVTVKKKETKRVKGKLKKVTVKVKQTEAEGLVMPNEFVGQNGAVIKQDTAISVTGCAKAKPAKKAKAKKKGKAKKGKKK